MREDKVEDDRKSKYGPLFLVRWHRVVLDEASMIRNYTTAKAHACFALVATHRWCLTGTPIENSVKDLYSLVRFLRIE